MIRKKVKHLLALSDEDFIYELKAIKQKYIKDNTWIHKGEPFVLGRIFSNFNQEEYKSIIERAAPILLKEEGELRFYEKLKFWWETRWLR